MNLALAICIEEFEHSSEAFNYISASHVISTETAMLVVLLSLCSMLYVLKLVRRKKFERIEAEYVEKPEQTISYEPDYKYYEK